MIACMEVHEKSLQLSLHMWWIGPSCLQPDLSKVNDEIWFLQSYIAQNNISVCVNYSLQVHIYP